MYGRLDADRSGPALNFNAPRSKFLRVGQRNFVRLFQPAELPQILHARRLQRQHHLGQIEPADFRHLMRRAFIVFRARPEAQARSRRGATGAARALVGVRLRNFFNQQRVDAAVGVVAGDARQAGINHQPHAVNRDARLRDVRGHDHFPLLITRHGGVLVLRLQFAMQRQHDVALGFAACGGWLRWSGKFQIRPA